MGKLERALATIERSLVEGTLVRDPDVLEPYSHDESEAEKRLPAAAIRVTSTHEVAAVMRIAHAAGIPVTPRGAGTGRVGGAVPVEGGLVLSFEKMNAISGIEEDAMLAVVQPGVVTGSLHVAAEEAGLFYGPDPNSFETCTLGGNIATNAGGPRAFKYGVTREFVLGMEVVLADGTIHQLGRRTRKGVTGYDLTALMVGSEGTLGIVTQATLKLLPKPEAVATLMVMLPDESAVESAITAALSGSVAPRCIELLDSITLEVARPKASLPIPDTANAMLIIELDGEARDLDRQLEICGNALEEAGALEILVARTHSERERLWAARREMSHALRDLADNKLAEDVVVPRPQVAELLKRCRAISEATGIRMPTYGHAGDGNLHVNFLWDDESELGSVKEGIRRLFEGVLSLGGTLSGEHGIGILKAPYLPMEQRDDLIRLQERIKQVFDEKQILNPGKIFPEAVRRFHGPC